MGGLGVHGCAGVCRGVHGCAWVCMGVQGCAGMCMGMYMMICMYTCMGWTTDPYKREGGDGPGGVKRGGGVKMGVRFPYLESNIPTFISPTYTPPCLSPGPSSPSLL